MRWWQITKRDTDLERELQSDLELKEEEQRERGLSQEEARRAARRAFEALSLLPRIPNLRLFTSPRTGNSHSNPPRRIGIDLKP